MPLISVIIPAYNAEKTIKQTIESVLNQTFSDFEIIVINDGSQDSTLEIVSSIPDPRIKVFSYPNAGPQKSRNRGWGNASGEYVSFLDADDLWTPDKLEAQLKALQENPAAAVAYSWTDYIDESGNSFPQSNHGNFSGHVFVKLLLADFVGNGSNPLIQKQALVEVGGFDESLVAGQDWDMWVRLASRYPFVAVPVVQILYRVSGNSWSTNLERREAGFKRVIEKPIAHAPDLLQPIKKDIIANRYKCLTVDALQGYPRRRLQGLIAAKFLWVAVSNDPSLLRRRAIWQVLLKIAIISLFPSKIAHELLNNHQIKRLSN